MLSLSMRIISKVLFFRPRWLIWIFRVILTFNFITPGFNNASHGYPLIVLVMAVLAYWLDLGRLTIFALVILFLATWINIDHFMYQYRE